MTLHKFQDNQREEREFIVYAFSQWPNKGYEHQQKDTSLTVSCLTVHGADMLTPIISWRILKGFEYYHDIPHERVGGITHCTAACMEHFSLSGSGPSQSCSNMTHGNTGSLIKV